MYTKHIDYHMELHKDDKIKFRRKVRKFKHERIVNIPCEIEGFEIGEMVDISVSDRGILIS